MTTATEPLAETPAEAPELNPEPPINPDEPAAPETEPDAEPDTEPDTEPEPEPLSEKQLDAAYAKLDKESTRHRARLAEIMGEEALLLEPCPLCEPAMAGWRFPVLPDADQWRAVEAAVFGGADAEYATAEYVKACGDCLALGEVATGSKVLGRATIPCRTCSGFGYVTADTSYAPPPPATPPGEQPAAFGPPSEEPPQVDFMGRDRSDPNYGVLAGFER